jgi:glycosyltransferase involved in cell wall biosynthesis
LRPALRVLHAIHDFLPRHQAGSEIYTFQLCRELSVRHQVTVVCADFDGGRRHGEVTWRDYDGLTVVEIVNNWACGRFADTYRSPLLTDRLAHVLRAVQPDVLHIHNLLNLSFDLPALAQAAGIPIVATLHDYTLVCASGGQRLHQADGHVCHDIDTERCVRCYAESPFAAQTTLGAVRSVPVVSSLTAAAGAMIRRLPGGTTLATSAARRLPQVAASRADLDGRLAAARNVFELVDLFVAPSPSMASSYRALGMDAGRLVVSDYGFPPLPKTERPHTGSPLRIGFVGTLVWHKGVHVLLEAIRRLPDSGWSLSIHGDLNVFPEYVSGLRRQAAGRPVSFCGRFDRADAAAIYSSIDLLVVPSLWLENSPLVIHEAFMAGVPVVGARIGGIADLIEDGNSGALYEPASPAALASTLAEFIADPTRVSRMAANLPRVKTIREDAAEWEGRYEAVIAQRKAPQTACAT